MKNGKNFVDKEEKNTITSTVQGIKNKIRNITGNRKKGMDCEEMMLERSKELSPDDFE